MPSQCGIGSSLDPLDVASSSLSWEEFQRGEDALSITQPSNSVKYISIQLSRAANAAECRECKSSLKCQSVRPSVWLCELRLTLSGEASFHSLFSLSPRQHSQRLSSRWLPSPPNFLQNSPSTFLHFNKHAQTLCTRDTFCALQERRTTHTHSLAHPARLEMSHFSARPRGWSFARVRIDIYLYPASDSNKHAWLQAIFARAREKYRITISSRCRKAPRRLTDCARCDVRRVAFQSGIRKWSLTKFWLKLAVLLRDL